MQKKLLTAKEKKEYQTNKQNIMIKVIIFGCQKITLDIIEFLKKQENVLILKLFTYEIPSDFARQSFN